jgi:dihydrofolate reductase
VVVNSVESALTSASQSDEVFIIGGAQLFEQTLSHIQRLYLTVIHHTFDGDAYFPELDMSEWSEQERVNHHADEQNAYEYSFITYDRVG